MTAAAEPMSMVGSGKSVGRSRIARRRRRSCCARSLSRGRLGRSCLSVKLGGCGIVVVAVGFPTNVISSMVSIVELNSFVV